MTIFNKIGDRLLNRLVPQRSADAADCWVEPCLNCTCPYPCYRQCCTGTGCAAICFC